MTTLLVVYASKMRQHFAQATLRQPIDSGAAQLGNPLNDAGKQLPNS